MNYAKKEPLPFELIHKKVCEYLGLDFELLFDNSNKRDIVYGRYLFYYFSKKYGHSNKAISNHVNRTVVGAYKGYRCLKDWLDVDKKVMRDVANLDSILSDIHDKQKVITLQQLLDVVCEFSGINQKFIKGKKSTSRVLRYRALFVAIAKENGFKYAQIGEFLNRKDSCVLKLKNKMIKRTGFIDKLESIRWRVEELKK